MPSSSQVLDRFRVTFDHDHAVADAGLILPATVAQRLGLGEAADALVDVGFRPGRKVATVVHGILAGADCIDDLDILRSGATERVLGHKAMAPSTVGAWLRSFTFGHVRQLDKLTEVMLSRAWAAGAGPGDQPMIIDVDSTVCEVHDRDGAGLSQLSGDVTIGRHGPPVWHGMGGRGSRWRPT